MAGERFLVPASDETAGAHPARRTFRRARPAPRPFRRSRKLGEAKMKHQLIGSTALVAVGLLAPAAQAADGVKLQIGGRYMGAAGVLAIDNFSTSPDLSDNLREYVFKQDVRVYFTGETVLDNGLTVGARVDLRGQTDTKDQIRDVYAYFSGGFGEIRFGDTEEALAQMCYLVPSASAIFGADSPNFNFSNAGVMGYGA